MTRATAALGATRLACSFAVALSSLPPVARSQSLPPAPLATPASPAPPAPRGFGPAYTARPLPGDFTPPSYDHSPRVLGSIGYALGVGGPHPNAGGSAVGIDATIGVAIDPVISIQLQATLGTTFGSHLARLAVVAGFAPIPEMSLGVGGSINYLFPIGTNREGIAVGLPLDFTFCLGPQREASQRRHGAQVSLRLDPAIALAPRGPSPAFYVYLVLGYITR